jgi:hypothetical protein
MKRGLISVCLALLLVSTSYSADPRVYLVQSWEDGTSGGLNSWGGTFIPHQTIGVTDGQWSLGVTGEIGWWFIGEMGIGAVGGTAFMNSKYIEMDVTTRASDWIGDSGFNMDFAIQGDGFSWTQWSNVMSEGWWSASAGNRTGTMKIDISPIVASLGNVAPKSLGIYLIMNSYSNDGQLTSYTAYFDNLRLCVPEPATLLLLGLGALRNLKRFPRL